MTQNNLYFAIRHINGWLRILGITGRNINELKEFELLDEEEQVFEKKQEKYYKKEIIPEAKRQEFEFIREMQRERPEKIIEIKQEKINKLMEKASKIISDYEKRVWKGSPVWLARIIQEMENPKEILKEIKKIQTEIEFLRFKTETNGITDQDIVKAKEYPFENLIEVNKAGFAFCSFHKEKTPSFYVKNNFGYCFGCGKSFDTIQFLMDTQGLSFVEAVKKLL